MKKLPRGHSWTPGRHPIALDQPAAGQRQAWSALALKMLNTALAQGIPALHLLVDAWFTSPKFCQGVKVLGLQIIGHLTRDHTLYYRDGVGYTLDQLYQAHKHRLVKAAALGPSLTLVPVRCGNGLQGAIVLTKGYKEPDLEARPGGKISRRSRLGPPFSPPTSP